jgi:hypothetical protein
MSTVSRIAEEVPYDRECVSPRSRSLVRSAPPALVLATYGIAFAAATLRPGLVFDDHPGQLYRLTHAVRVGWAPWRWNPGWFAGYAELQFYPPAFAYLGASLHHISLGMLSVEQCYQIALWIAYLLPGFTTYALLARVLPTGWLALPGAFLALTLSAGSRSGVEEGVRWGLVAARLGWGLLPLLARSLVSWVEGAPRVSAWTAPLLAAVILCHPAHAPAAVCFILVAAWVAPLAAPVRTRQALMTLLAGVGLAAFWLLPLLVHRQMALPLAWGDGSLRALAWQVGRQPLLVILAAATVLGLARWRRLIAASRPAAWLVASVPLAALMIIGDAVLDRLLGQVPLPADRLMDGFLLTLILGGWQAVHLIPRVAALRPPWMSAALGLGLVAAAALPSWGTEPTLSLAPDQRQWPTYDLVARGLRLEELWRALGQAPPGRVLFVRSAVPLEYRPEWWRPHSHVTALAPVVTGREILNGTFTHPSPIAGLIYTGSPRYAAITRLVEERDGETLFGRRLEDIAPDEFNRLAERLAISVVVALDEDEGRIGFLTRNPELARHPAIGPFRLFVSRRARPLPAVTGAEARRLDVTGHAGGWLSTPLAYSPLWQARAGDRALRTAPDDLGLLAIDAPPAITVIDLRHTPGAAEWSGVGVSALTVILLGMAGAWARHEARRSGPRSPLGSAS